MNKREQVRQRKVSPNFKVQKIKNNLNETNFTDISHITDESNNVNIPLVKKTIYSKQKYVPKKDSGNKKNSESNGGEPLDSP